MNNQIKQFINEQTLKLYENTPQNWKVLRNKVFLKPKKIKSESGEEDLLSVSEYYGVKPKSHGKETDSNFLSRSESLEGYLRVSEGDLVNNIMLMWKRGLGVSNYGGIVSPSYSVFEFKFGIPNYFNYLFRTEEYISEFRRNSTGVIMSRLRLYDDNFLSLKSHFPPIDEQQLIVSYLGKKTQNLDELIKTINKKIELLKEQKTSLINEVVTKGLNPNVEMKDSGVEWIGEIPSHWEIKKIKYMGFIKLSSVDRKENIDERRVNICHYPDVYNNEKVTNETKLPSGSCTEDEFKKFSLVKNDILITKDSESPDDIGIPTFVDDHLENTVCGYHISQIRITNTEIIPEFVFRYIESTTVKDYFFISSNGVTRYGLGKPSVESLYVTCPPKDEQESIVEFLDEQTQRIDKTITKEEKRITLFKEYKQSLISEVVTGKKRVTEDMV